MLRTGGMRTGHPGGGDDPARCIGAGRAVCRVWKGRLLFDRERWRSEVLHKGAEREPVVTIDGFATDPGALVRQAGALRFARTSPHYPGLRAAMAPDACASLLAALQPLCEAVFGATPGLESACYSLVTTPPAQLAPIQRLPHYDGMEPDRLALVLYLCPPHHGGTAFYRHRSSGFETVTPERFAAYRDALQADVQRHGMPPAAYIASDTPLFERIAAPPPAFNRALVYRGRNLHSGDIAPEFPCHPDPATGRLTVTAFFV